MSIKSNAFGGVVLTGEDAKKFQAQVTYGKPSKAAVTSVARGLAYSRQFEQDGKLTLVVKRQKGRV